MSEQLKFDCANRTEDCDNANTCPCLLFIDKQVKSLENVLRSDIFNKVTSNIDFNNRCESDRKRICYDISSKCEYSGEKIDDNSRKCNAYELSEGTIISCSGLYVKNQEE